MKTADGATARHQGGGGGLISRAKAVAGAFYYRLGFVIASYPVCFVLLSLAVAAACVAGLHRLELRDDVRFGYTPKNARSRRENAAFMQFYNVSHGPLGVAVLMQSKDGGSLLRPAHWVATERLYNHLVSRLPISFGNETVYYADLCEPICDWNSAFWIFKEFFDNRTRKAQLGQPLDPHIQLDFPVTKLYGNDLPLATNFYLVETAETVNRSLNVTSIEKVGLVVFYFFADKTANPARQKALDDWEKSLFDLSLEPDSFPLVRFHAYGDAVTNREIKRAGERTYPFLTIGFSLLFMFIMLTVCGGALYHGNMDACKPLVALAALVCPLLATGTTFGVFSWLGLALNGIASVTPFLVLGIGVDDAFLMVHAWQRLGGDGGGAADKLGRVFREIGPSVTITSVTNTVAFTVGAFSPMSQIRLFCALTACAILVDFVYQLTFFAAALALFGESRRPRRRPLAVCEAIVRGFGRLIDAYSEFVAGRLSKLLLVVVLAVCWSASARGIWRMQTVFVPEKTFRSDSPLSATTNLITGVIKTNAQRKTFIVDSPPDIADTERYRRFMRLVDELESTDVSVGRNSTLLWLRPYESYFERTQQFDLFNWLGMGDDDAAGLTYEKVPEFFEQPFLGRMNTSVHWHRDASGKVVVDSFAFVTAYKNSTFWPKRVVEHRRLREIVDRYGEFNVSVFDFDATIYDLILVMDVVTRRAVLITTACMAVVCFLFIPSLLNVLIACAAIASICVCVIGGLSWWGADMDPITMVNVIMAIGFCVDYTAHISYHYYASALDARGRQRRTADRLKLTLRAVAWPMVQAGVSSVIVVLPLLFNTVYTLIIFVKTIVLVVSWGFVHGLFVLPTVLTLLPDSCASCCRRQPRGQPADDADEAKEMMVKRRMSNGDAEAVNGTAESSARRQTARL